jgi:hypothetical protein
LAPEQQNRILNRAQQSLASAANITNYADITRSYEEAARRPGGIIAARPILSFSVYADLNL